MKINTTPTPKHVNQAYSSQTNGLTEQNPKPKAPADETLTDIGDSVNLSGKTRDLQKISKVMSSP